MRVGLRLTDDIVRRLRMVTAPGKAPLPLAQVSRAAWAQLPVGIQLAGCVTPFLTLSPHACRLPNVSVPLGELIGGNGNGASPVATVVPVSLPAWGNPNRFPSDSYVINMAPVITLPGAVVLPNLFGSSDGVPTAVTVSEGPGLAKYWTYAYVNSPKNRRVIGVAIHRDPNDTFMVYAVALLPLLLAVVLAHVWVRRRGVPGFDLGFAAGMVAVMLAILPLRAVLVPGDVAASPTVLDDILILGVLLIAGFLFWQYARFVRGPKPPKRKDDDASPGEVPRLHHSAPDGSQPPETGLRS